MFGRATIRLGIGPHSSFVLFLCFWHFVCFGIYGLFLFYVVCTSAIDSRNDLLCVERDVKHLLTHSLTPICTSSATFSFFLLVISGSVLFTVVIFLTRKDFCLGNSGIQFCRSLFVVAQLSQRDHATP